MAEQAQEARRLSEMRYWSALERQQAVNLLSELAQQLEQAEQDLRCCQEVVRTGGLLRQKLEQRIEELERAEDTLKWTIRHANTESNALRQALADLIQQQDRSVGQPSIRVEKWHRAALETVVREDSDEG